VCVVGFVLRQRENCFGERDSVNVPVLN